MRKKRKCIIKKNLYEVTKNVQSVPMKKSISLDDLKLKRRTNKITTG